MNISLVWVRRNRRMGCDLILVSVKELRSTDVLAVDIYDTKKRLLCAKGVTLTREVAKRLERCGLESVHIQDRDGERPEMNEAQRQQLQGIIDQRFQHADGDDFMRHLKLVVTQTLIVRKEGEEDAEPPAATAPAATAPAATAPAATAPEGDRHDSE